MYDCYRRSAQQNNSLSLFKNTLAVLSVLLTVFSSCLRAHTAVHNYNTIIQTSRAFSFYIYGAAIIKHKTKYIEKYYKNIKKTLYGATYKSGDHFHSRQSTIGKYLDNKLCVPPNLLIPIGNTGALRSFDCDRIRPDRGTQ